MTKRAELADGTILEFPDETPDDVMDRAVRQHLAASEESSPSIAQAAQADFSGVTSRTLPNPRVPTDTEQLYAEGKIPGSFLIPLESVEQGLRAARQGLSLGFADELQGALSGAGAVLRGEDFGPAYRAERDRERALSHQFAEDHPGSNILGQVGGGLLTAPIPAKVAAQAPTLLRQVGRSIPIGAGVGALAGFGAGEGTPGQQLQSTERGAVTGALVAPAVTTALAGVSALAPTARAVWQRLFPRGPVTETFTVPTGAPNPITGQPSPTVQADVTARPQALELLAATLRKSGVSPDEIERQLIQAEQLGIKPENLADFLGEAGARRLRASKTLGGAGTKEAMTRLAERGEGTAARVSQDVQDATTQRGQSLSQLEARIANRRAVGNTLYNEAFKHGAITDPDTVALISNPRAAGILKAAEDRSALAADLGGNPFTRLFKETDAGPVLARAPTVEDVHRLKTSLDDDIQKAFKDGNGEVGKALRDYKNTLVKRLEDEVPAYRKARETYKGDREIEDAIANGRADILRLPVDQLRRDFQALSGAEQDAYRSGAIDHLLAQKVDRFTDSADFAHKLWGNADMRNRLQLLVKNEDELAKLVKQFSREARIAQTNRGVFGGSTTATQAVDVAEQTAGSLADVATQGPKGAFVSTVANWIRRAGGVTEPVADDIAKLLTDEDPATIRAVLKSLQGREQAAVLRALNQSRTGRAAAGTSAQQNGTP